MRQHNAPRRLHFCLALLSVLSAMNPALSLATSHPEPIEEVTAMPLAPHYHLSRLDNGMQVILIKTDSSQPGASVRMRIAAGSLQEDAGYEPGLAHFLEHMAFNGSTHLRENEMVPFLEKHGISFGSHLNAETLFDETIYKLETPDTAESLDAA
ncbi:M16 family metallopeptidase [Photobacterium sp. TY1-4]|uniref:M16 family metallopeptidase n=1 Tax=Photobacterium sp. TY1-4 TaxID=2899122 RepID=UPI0021BDF3DB|nr:insulinase family protein [Photobacterium sp. TY1-4]UXI04008.1 insulinase family protein [Photobacterium sp. TY1-4]